VKRRYLLIVGVIVVLLLGSFLGSQQEQPSMERQPKIAYVSIQKAVESYAEWKKLNERYMKDYQFYQQKLSELEDEWKKLKESGASSDVLRQKEQEILTKKQQYEQTLQQEYGQKSQEVIKAVAGKAADFARTMGYDILLNEQGALYVDPAFDVTDAFIAYLNQGYEGP